MFLYKDTVGGFKRDVDENLITGILELWFERMLGRKVAPSERESWRTRYRKK